MLKLHQGTSGLENNVLQCLDAFLSSIETKTVLCSSILDAKLSHTVGNMMNEILFGIHYDESDVHWQRIQSLRENGIKELHVATPVNFLPWLRHLMPRFKKTLAWLIQGKEETHMEYKKVIEKYSKNNEECLAGYFYMEKQKKLMTAAD